MSKKKPAFVIFSPHAHCQVRYQKILVEKLNNCRLGFFSEISLNSQIYSKLKLRCLQKERGKIKAREQQKLLNKTNFPISLGSEPQTETDSPFSPSPACAPPKSFRRKPDNAPMVKPNQDKYRGQAIDLNEAICLGGE